MTVLNDAYTEYTRRSESGARGQNRINTAGVPEETAGEAAGSNLPFLGPKKVIYSSGENSMVEFSDWEGVTDARDVVPGAIVDELRRDHLRGARPVEAHHINAARVSRVGGVHVPEQERKRARCVCPLAQHRVHRERYVLLGCVRLHPERDRERSCRPEVVERAVGHHGVIVDAVEREDAL